MPTRGYEFYLWVSNLTREEETRIQKRICNIPLIYNVNNNIRRFSNFPKISEDFLKISEHF